MYSLGCVFTLSKEPGIMKFWYLSWIWRWRSSLIGFRSIGILTKDFRTPGPNLMILAWTGGELLHGQVCDWQTERRTGTQTDAGNDNTLSPKLASGNKKWNIIQKQNKNQYQERGYLLHSVYGKARTNCTCRASQEIRNNGFRVNCKRHPQ